MTKQNTPCVSVDKTSRYAVTTKRRKL